MSASRWVPLSPRRWLLLLSGTGGGRKTYRCALFLTCCALLMSSVAGGIHVARYLQAHNQGGVAASLTADRLDFGDAWEQRAFRWTVPVTNLGTRALHIEEVQGDCDCTAIVPQNFELAPGATQELTLTIDLTQSDWAEDEQARSFESMLKPRLAPEANSESPVWLIRGRVQRNPISASPPLIDFGNELIVGMPFPSRDSIISLAAGNHLTGIEARCVPPEAGRAVLDALDGEPGRYRLKVTPAESLGRGRFSFSVLISALEPAVPRSPVLDVNVVGTVQGDIVAQPDRVMFGARAVGGVGVDYVLLFSHEGRPLRVRIVQESPGVTATPAPGSEPELRVFELRQEFSSVGERWGSVQFEAGYIDSDEPAQLILVETLYHGTQPPREAGS